MPGVEGRGGAARVRRWLAPLALLMLLPLTRAHADELRPFTVSFTWTYHGMSVALSTLSLVRRDSETWVYTSHSEPRGIGRLFAERPAMESVMRITAAGVQPLTYRASAGTSSSRRDINVRFDWEHGRVTGVYENTPVDMPLEPGTQDDLSVQIALMYELLRGHTPDKLLLLDRNKTREYRYSRENEESLDTAIGRVPTVVYASTKQFSPRVNRYWCAPDRGFLPMKVEQKNKDNVEWTMLIQSAKRD